MPASLLAAQSPSPSFEVPFVPWKEFAMITNNQRPLWLELYAEAVLEPDPEKFVARICCAHEVIQCRFLELEQEGTASAAERERLMSASYFLQRLRQNIGIQEDR
jgi:hypothetical protein